MLIGKGSLTGEEPTLRMLAVKLTEKVKEFSRDDLRVALGDVDEEELDRVLTNLLEDGVIYEATAGRYRPA